MENLIDNRDLRAVENTYTLLENIYKGTTFKLASVARNFDDSAFGLKFDSYRAAVMKVDKPSEYSINIQDLFGHGLTTEQISKIMSNLDLMVQFLDEDVIEAILNPYRQVVIDSYVEESPYYRMVMGLPTLDDTFNIYVDSSWDDKGVDSTKPIHTMLESELYILYNGGELTRLKDVYPTKLYIQYLHRRADPIDARMGAQFDIIKLGDGDITTKTMFESMYNKNKAYFMKTFYNEYYVQVTNYYEQLMVVYLVWQTMTDCARELMGGIEVDYLSESDVDNVFKDHMIPALDIPMKVKSEVAKAMNTLIRFKGSVKSIMDIAKIFNVGSVYKYIIQKHWINGVASLRAKKVQLDNSDLKTVLGQDGGWISFEDLVDGDPRWTSVNDNYYSKILENDFSFIETKYITVENAIDLTQLSLDMSMFYAHMLKHSSIANSINIFHKQANINMNVIEAYSFMTALMSARYGFSDDIPKSIQEVDYITNSKVWGLNDVKLTDIPVLRHQWKKIMFDTNYATLLEEFISTDSQATFSEFINNYARDKNIVDIILKIKNDTEDTIVRDLMDKVIDALTKLHANLSVFGGALTHTEFLQNSNPPLYNRLKVIEASADVEEEATSEISTIISLLEETLSGYDTSSHQIFWFYEGLSKLEFAELKALLTQIIFYFKSRNVDLKDVDMVLNIIDKHNNSYNITEHLTCTTHDTQEDGPYTIEDLEFSETSKREFSMDVLDIGESLLELSFSGIEFNRIK